MRWTCGIAVLAIACVGACFGALVRPKAANDAPFAQYTSQAYLYQGSPADAGPWDSAPFAGSINGTAYLPAADCFVLLIMKSAQESELWRVGAYDSAQPAFSLVTALPSSPCHFSKPLSGGDDILLVCSNTTASSFSISRVACGNATCNVDALAAGVPAPGQVMDVALYEPQAGSLAVPTVLVATTNGLLQCQPSAGTCALMQFKNTTGGLSTAIYAARVFCLPKLVTSSPTEFLGGRCFVASRTTYCASNLCPADLLHVVNATLAVTHFVRIPGVIDAWPRGITYDPTADAVHFANEVCVNSFHRNGTLHRVGGVRGGLPQKFLTSADASSFGAWFGSEQGAMVRMPAGNWKYMYGPRWLPGKTASPTPAMHVTSLATSSSTGATVVATETGFAIIRRVVQTLKQKAEHLQVFEHYLTRWGLAPASKPLAVWGDVTSAVPADQMTSANEGLWTSMYLASQIFRYASTGDPAVKAGCWSAFNAMRRLCTVTGVRGLCAREYINKSMEGQGGWFPSPTMPGWWFNGNPSSDEVTGHLHVYPLMHDMIAETDEERALIIDLIVNITSNIVDNGLILKQISGEPSQWGRWNPGSLNDEPFWYDERGLNSLQILAFLSSGYRLTLNQTYADVFNELVAQHGYATNVVNLKITQPDDVDFSDDELTFVAYFMLLWSRRPSAKLQHNPLYESVKSNLLVSIERTYDYVHKERPDLWAAIYLFAFEGAAPRESTAAGDLTWCMQTWPLSVVKWPTNNTARLDVLVSPYPNRHDVIGRLMTTLLPYDEVSLLVWNDDPFDRVQGDGGVIGNPAYYLYPYWLGHWLGYV